MSLSGPLDFSKLEPLISDERVAVLAEKLRSEFGRSKLDKTELVTFIQPAREVNREVNGIQVKSWIPEMAVFGAVTPNPRPNAKGTKLLTSGTASLLDWQEAEDERGHFAGRSDPAYNIFRGVVREHLRIVGELEAML